MPYLERETAALDRILQNQDGRPASALSDDGDARCAIERIELALLGETAEWSMRRTFGSVA